MTEDAKKLAILMGVPVLEAPGEAEAQCAELVRSERAYAAATEDMDARAFGARILLRGFSSQKAPVTQIDLAETLDGFKMNMEQFVDLCILCGCDFTGTISGIGPARAFKFIQDVETIENVLDVVERENKDPAKRVKPNHLVLLTIH